jgi:hypothetical protein
MHLKRGSLSQVTGKKELELELELELEVEVDKLPAAQRIQNKKGVFHVKKISDNSLLVNKKPIHKIQ